MMMSGGRGVGGGGGGGGGAGPCGACKFLRRKCVKGCIFAPYFDSEQGTTHFAAVHRVFGASNASKMLLRIPPHRRLDAVITLCYEALARVRDPVYGCVAHIFTLQQQVVNLQAELAYVQARISTLQRSGPLPPISHPSPPSLPPSSTIQTGPFGSEETPTDFVSFCDVSIDEELGHCHHLDQDDHVQGDDLVQSLAREYYILKYFPGVRFKPYPPPQ